MLDLRKIAVQLLQQEQQNRFVVPIISSRKPPPTYLNILQCFALVQISILNLQHLFLLLLSLYAPLILNCAVPVSQFTGKTDSGNLKYNAFMVFPTALMCQSNQ